jgi:hypothetical protein
LKKNFYSPFSPLIYPIDAAGVDPLRLRLTSLSESDRLELLRRCKYVKQALYAWFKIKGPKKWFSRNKAYHDIVLKQIIYTLFRPKLTKVQVCNRVGYALLREVNPNAVLLQLIPTTVLSSHLSLHDPRIHLPLMRKSASTLTF